MQMGCMCECLKECVSRCVGGISFGNVVSFAVSTVVCQPTTRNDFTMQMTFSMSLRRLIQIHFRFFALRVHLSLIFVRFLLVCLISMQFV